MKCTSCDDELDLGNNGFAVRQECMHTVCLDCHGLKICGACFKAQQLQQKKLQKDKQIPPPFPPKPQPKLATVDERQHRQQPIMVPPPVMMPYGPPFPPYLMPRPPYDPFAPHTSPVWPAPPLTAGLMCPVAVTQKMIKERVEATSLHQQSQQILRQKAADSKKEVNQRKIKIGNLPYSTTSEQLSTIFSLCGGIEEAFVFPYKDFNDEEQNYGLITFTDEEAAKLALLHHNKVLRGHVITVANNKDANYPIFVANFPAGNEEDNVLSYFAAYGEVISVSKQQDRQFFVNFAEHEIRQKVMTSYLTAPSRNGLVTLKLSLKEPPKKTGTISATPDGEAFSLFTEDIRSPYISKPLIEGMFEIFGPISTKHVRYAKDPVMKKMLATWKIDFATEAMRDQALQFNNRQPNKWEVNILLSVDNGQAQIAPSGSPSIQNTKSSSTSAISSTNMALGSGASTETLPEISTKGKSSSQPLLNQGKFAVLVTGFDTSINEKDLEIYFSDAGTIVKCKVKHPKNGHPFAEIIYGTEEEMNKAISWSPCLLGYPTQTLIIQRFY